MTTSTIMATSQPPVPHRDLPGTGTDTLLLPSAGLALVSGLLLTVWARRARQKRTQRFVVKQGLNHWWVLDQVKNRAVKAMPNKDAAKNYAQVLNANLTPLHPAPEEDK